MRQFSVRFALQAETLLPIEFELLLMVRESLAQHPSSPSTIDLHFRTVDFHRATERQWR